jgi:protein SCO1/2
MDGPSTPQRDRLIWVGIGLTMALIVLALLLAALRLGSAFSKPLPVYGQVGDFTLTNQLGRSVSLADLRGRVWVADIIFTRCAGPCLKMSRQMKELQQALPASSRTLLVSLTTDPDFDSPQVLKTYGDRFEADSNRWLFLTGSKKQIASLATDSLKLTAIEKKPEERESPADLFIHSTISVVVDKRGQLRGIFEATGEGVDPLQAKSQILAAVRRLERER